jgi:hypothetical protein
MKKLFTLLAAVFITVAFSTQVQAQRGDVALGLRLTPDGGGATAKFFVADNLALEGQLNAGGVLGGDGTSLTVVGLAEYHIILPDPSWRIFFGGGFHGGQWDRDDYRGTQGIFGIDAIGGAEYVFKRIPLGLSADFKPAINFVSDAEFFPHNLFGASARFYIGRVRTQPAHTRG